MIMDAAQNIHLRRQATKLLLFYADQNNGFRPALKLIKRKTGIPENKVSEVRKRLIDRGLIAYEPEDFIMLDWQRIRTFAALEKPLRLPKNGNCFFAPVKPYLKEPTLREIWYKEGYWIKNPRPLTDTEKKFYNTAARMTEFELMSLMHLLPSQNGGT